jgi:hypothetical protein
MKFVVSLVHTCFSELLNKGKEWTVTCRTTGLQSLPALGNSRGVTFLGVVTLTERQVTARF